MEPPIEPVTDEPLPSTDSRVAAVGDNLERFVATVADADGFVRGDDPDVTTLWSDYPFPLFNAISRARFAPGTVERRAREVVAAYIGRGLPFLWWATPSTTSPALEQACAAAGMMLEEVPGMHRPLTEPVDVRAPEGLRLELAPPESIGVLTDVMLAGFGMPGWLKDPMIEMFGGFASEELVNVLATLDGEPVASGSAYLGDGTAGIYNIATLEDFRGRGIGYAVTAWLMNAGLERGCDQTILHASQDGFPVYERLGYETVCTLSQMAWVPSD